jgi:predicted lipoprotein with Yx(FWY)xxD motif
MRNRWLVAPALAAAAVLLAACGSHPSNTGDPAANNAAATASHTAGPVKIKTKHTSKGTVLVNAADRTLYWFARDTSSKSNCNGSCASYWPPVIAPKGEAWPGTKLPHGFGTIKRSDGQTQVTYDGHPLYTYSGDTSGGMVTGNDKNLSGGLWWAMTPSGSILGKSSSSGSGGKSSSGGSGGSSGGGGW